MAFVICHKHHYISISRLSCVDLFLENAYIKATWVDFIDYLGGGSTSQTSQPSVCTSRWHWNTFSFILSRLCHYLHPFRSTGPWARCAWFAPLARRLISLLFACGHRMRSWAIWAFYSFIVLYFLLLLQIKQIFSICRTYCMSEQQRQNCSPAIKVLNLKWCHLYMCFI